MVTEHHSNITPVTYRDKLERIALQTPLTSGDFLANALPWIRVTPSLSWSIRNTAAA